MSAQVYNYNNRHGGVLQITNHSQSVLKMNSFRLIGNYFAEQSADIAIPFHLEIIVVQLSVTGIYCATFNVTFAQSSRFPVQTKQSESLKLLLSGCVKKSLNQLAEMRDNPELTELTNEERDLPEDSDNATLPNQLPEKFDVDQLLRDANNKGQS